MTHVTRSEKEELVRLTKSITITLNGEPAKLTNIKTKTPTVKSSTTEKEFNWKTIQLTINENNGNFIS
jgi:hypothetical protein